jgi:quinol-cytochrome oxidoreductase complex cytochrome b subunit
MTKHQGWFAERFAARALEYEVPARANRLDFMLGGLTLTALVVLALSGIVLTQYYNPAPLGAHESVRFIITGQPVASVLRDLHAWSASAAIVLVFAHLATIFWRRGFRRPREGLWWSGVVLLALVFGLAFTGTALRGDQDAVEAVAHSTAGAKLAGPLGALLRPEFTASTPLLSRLYAFHVSVLPLAMVALLALHLWLVRHLGVSAGGTERATFRRHLRPLAGAGFVVVAIAATAALIWPASLSAPGVAGYEVTKPFWPFLWIYAAENLFGMPGLMLAPAVLFGFLALVPVTDQGAGKSASATRVVGVALFILMIVAIVYAAVAPGQSHLGMNM